MLVFSLLKVAVFLVGWLIVWLPIGTVAARILAWQPTQILTTKQKLTFLASLYPLAPLIIWWWLSEEGLAWRDIGITWQPNLLISLSIGLLLGIAGMGIVFALESLLGWVVWHWQHTQRLLTLALPLLLVGLGIGIIEELVFRGFIIQELATAYSYWLAAAISSIIFALLHLVWERAETLPQLPGLWLMGMVLAGARLVDDGSLGLAWGLHTGWIWGLSCLDAAELINYSDKGLSWMIGINRQPLAGLAGILCLLGTGATLWLFS